MTRHHYPLHALAGDYARSSLGVALTGGPLLLGSSGSAMIWVLAPLAVLFASFGIRTALRQTMRIEMSEEGIRQLGFFRATISWERLNLLRLRYYSSKRGRSRPSEPDGWMQASIGGGGRRIKVDSALTDFDAVIRRASAAARARGLVLDDATLHNLRAVGAIADGID